LNVRASERLTFKDKYQYMKLENKVAFITGGNKGIGYGIAEYLLKEGMKVAISSRSIASAQAAAKDLAPHGEVLALELDVRNYSAQEKAVADILEKWGQLDLVVANAGIGHFASIEDMDIEQWNTVIDTNVNGVFYTSKAAIPALKNSKGYIITISSLAGPNFFQQGTAYNASKFAVTGFSQAMMLDLRKYGIRVSTIMPGSVTSNFNGHEPSDSDAWKIQPEDIGELVADLMKMNPRTLPSKIEVRPTTPPSAKA
jgi:3-oxoacyl-[acyl-carrier protein] reductase